MMYLVKADLKKFQVCSLFFKIVHNVNGSNKLGKDVVMYLQGSNVTARKAVTHQSSVNFFQVADIDSDRKIK